LESVVERTEVPADVNHDDEVPVSAEPSEAGSGEGAVPVTQPPEARLILRRKTEEVTALRCQARPTSGKVIRKVMTSEPSQDPYRPPSGHMYAPGNTAPNDTRSSYRRTAGLYSTWTAWGKWQSLEQHISNVIMQRMTISNMETDMNRLLKQREEMTKRKEKVIRKRERLAREELEREDEGTPPPRRRGRRPTRREGSRPRAHVPP